MRKLIAAVVLVAAVSLPSSALAFDGSATVTLTPSTITKKQAKSGVAGKLKISAKVTAAPGAGDVSVVGDLKDAVATIQNVKVDLSSAVETTEDEAKAGTAPAESVLGSGTVDITYNGTPINAELQLLYGGGTSVITLVKVPSLNNFMASAIATLKTSKKSTTITLPLAAVAAFFKSSGSSVTGSGGTLSIDASLSMSSLELYSCTGNSRKATVQLNSNSATLYKYSKKIACKTKS